jgi:hypothetical protein
MAFIDGVEVPENLAGDPISNIRFIDGQWVLVPGLGKSLPAEYRTIPEKLLKSAVLFQDRDGKKVGFIANTLLETYLKSVTPPRDSAFDAIKKEIDDTVKAIQKSAEDIRQPDPEVAKLSEKFRGQYLAPGQTRSERSGFLPLNQDGTIKQAGVAEAAEGAPASADLAQTTLGETTRTTTRGIDAKDKITDRWAAVGTVDLSSGVPRDANGNEVYILSQNTPTGPKAYTSTQKDIADSVATMTPAVIKQYQQALKSVGVWNYEVDGQLNYLTRAKFIQGIETAAAAVTQENLLAYGRKDTTPKSILDVINAAARQTATGATTSTNVSIINRDAAQVYLDNTYLNSIGRKATKKEVDEFYQKVQKEAKARPTVTTTTGTQTTTRKGFDETSVVGMAAAQAEERPEFLAYQLSTNFYNALLGASRLPVQFGAGEAPVTGPVG